MKRGTKIWLIIAASLVTVGILIIICTMAVGHRGFSLREVSGYSSRTVDIDEDFSNISIHASTEDIRLIPSDAGDCKVVFYEPSDIRAVASVDDGTLSIVTSDLTDVKDWLLNISFFRHGTPAITVYLPQSGYTQLYIDSHTGAISVPDNFSFENIEISNSTGDVSCFASASGTITIVCTTGHVNIEDLSAGDLNISSSTGDIRVKSAACTGSIEIAVDTGNTELSDITCKSFTSTGNTGDIFLNEVTAVELISIGCSTGDISFSRCDSQELLITSDTGNVTGTLLSDKVFIVKSQTGYIDVPETSTGGKCKIVTNTGDVVIGIESR